MIIPKISLSIDSSIKNNNLAKNPANRTYLSNGSDTVSFAGGRPISYLGRFLEGVSNALKKVYQRTDEYNYESILKLFNENKVKFITFDQYEMKNDRHIGKRLQVQWKLDPKASSDFGPKNEILKGGFDAKSEFEFDKKGRPLKFIHAYKFLNKTYLFDKSTRQPLHLIETHFFNHQSFWKKETVHYRYSQGVIVSSEKNTLYKNNMTEKTTIPSFKNQSHVIKEIFDANKILRRSVEENPSDEIKRISKKFYPDGKTLKTITTTDKTGLSKVERYSKDGKLIPDEKTKAQKSAEELPNVSKRFHDFLFPEHVAPLI